MLFSFLWQRMLCVSVGLSNPCLKMSCDFLCLLNPTGARCTCPEGKSLINGSCTDPNISGSLRRPRHTPAPHAHLFVFLLLFLSKTWDKIICVFTHVNLPKLWMGWGVLIWELTRHRWGAGGGGKGGGLGRESESERLGSFPRSRLPRCFWRHACESESWSGWASGVIFCSWGLQIRGEGGEARAEIQTLLCFFFNVLIKDHYRLESCVTFNVPYGHVMARWKMGIEQVRN